MKNPLAWILIGVVKIYQIFISPLKPPLCRFRPTCSEYLVQAIRVKGLVRGSWMAIRRIARCHPFCEGGFDPVIPEGRRHDPSDPSDPTEARERSTAASSE